METIFQIVKANPFRNPFSSIPSGSNDTQGLSSLKTPVPSRSIHFASAADPDEVPFGSTKYFMLCGLGGAISCGTTHTAIVSLDLVKCRMQVDSVKYPGLIKGFQVSLKEDGMKGLVRGWAPTFIGYSMQGLCKFGFYEYFKILYSDLVGPENYYLYRSGVYLAASASAEFFADIALSPMETVKVKIQTKPGFGSTLREAWPKIVKTEGYGGFYAPLIPLWGRQIPYTMMKFASFEKTVELLYEYVVPKPRELTTKPEQLMVTFAAGYIAGIFCAIVSHPADTLVSKLSQDKSATVGDVYRKVGMAGLWKGLGPRIIMIGTLTALQWFIYDAFKVAFHLPRPPPPHKPPTLP
jgi:solute carrier family 25 phosphate transporter 3